MLTSTKSATKTKSHAAPPNGSVLLVSTCAGLTPGTDVVASVGGVAAAHANVGTWNASHAAKQTQPLAPIHTRGDVAFDVKVSPCWSSCTHTDRHVRHARSFGSQYETFDADAKSEMLRLLLLVVLDESALDAATQSPFDSMAH